MPGIKTTEKVADDVNDENLEILLKDKTAQMDVAFLNSKGFGGNNATASVLSPGVVENMLAKRYGESAFSEYKIKREAVRETAKQYDELAVNGNLNVIYNFGSGIIDDQEIKITDQELSVESLEQSINLQFANPYADMT